MNKKIAMVTLGCSKNQVDSEVMSGLLSSQYELTDQTDEAHVIVVNTCTFIESAKEESVEAILEMARLKQEGVCETLIAAGCLAQRYSAELQEEIPELDGIVGTGGITRILEVIAEAQNTERRAPVLYVGTPDFLYDETMPRLLSTPRASAYVKIAEGCDNFCTYCVIPLVRGRFRSRTEESILREAENLTRQGVKEIMLIAQDTTRYGLDRYGELRLPSLIRQLAKIDGIEWIRLLYCYPDMFSDELIQVMTEEPKVCRYVDLPLQHGDDKILKEMNRRGTVAEAETLIVKLRAAMPDITIRTTMITGFPGETEDDFNNLAAFVGKIKFDRLGVFAYSQEENTPAGQRPDQIAPEIREERKDKIMALQQTIAVKRQQRWVGKLIKVLLEEKLPDGRWLARSEGDAPEIDGQVYIQPHVELESKQVGDMVQVMIEQADSYDLIGEVAL